MRLPQTGFIDTTLYETKKTKKPNRQMALWSSNMRSTRNSGITLTGPKSCSRRENESPNWRGLVDRSLTMFSGRLLCQWSGKCQPKWSYGNLVAYAIKKEISKWTPVKFFQVVGDTDYLFFFPKGFFQTSFSSFFFFASIFYHNTQTSTTLSPHDCY